MNAHIHIGSCAWSFEDWRGGFDPAEVPASRWLAHYAHVFDSVEIDSTFFGNPAPETIAHWLAETSGQFRFTCKAPKAITHEARLRDCEGPLEQFLAAMQPMHARLGAVLFQLPPSFTPNRDATALREFVRRLPHGWKYAIEFRDAGWHQPRFARMLEEHGVCWVWSDTTSVADQDVAPFGFLPETADFLYLRLMGDLQTKYGPDGERRFSYREVLWPRAAAIESWSVRLHKLADQMRNIYVMCSNHYEGFAPASCREFGRRMGVEIALPANAEPEVSGKGPRQMKLL